jgi:DNA-binding transcriptional regulator YdaS (Cro superfamily)
MWRMTKTQASDLFGGTQAALAKALGITPGAVSQWPEILTPKQEDWVRGAAVRLGIIQVCTAEDCHRDAA